MALAAGPDGMPTSTSTGAPQNQPLDGIYPVPPSPVSAKMASFNRPGLSLVDDKMALDSNSPFPPDIPEANVPIPAPSTVPPARIMISLPAVFMIGNLDGANIVPSNAPPPITF